uniref:Uncharacterized protein n=1 Tax=Arundo donax TaxID=35708 RepID=A0A0A9GTB3_ARUDO
MQLIGLFKSLLSGWQFSGCYDRTRRKGAIDTCVCVFSVERSMHAVVCWCSNDGLVGC